MREGLENIVVNFHCIQMSTKNVVVCYQTTDSTKRHNSKTVWSICMKFPGIMCLVMKNICGKFRCKQTSSRKVIALAFIYVNPHLAYSMNDAYMPCAFERMTHMCVNQRLRWNVTKVYEQASDWEGGFPHISPNLPENFLCAKHSLHNLFQVRSHPQLLPHHWASQLLLMGLLTSQYLWIILVCL